MDQFSYLQSKLVGMLGEDHRVIGFIAGRSAKNYTKKVLKSLSQSLPNRRMLKLSQTQETQTQANQAIRRLGVDLVEGVERLLGRVELGSDLLLRAPARIELIDRLVVARLRVVVVVRDLVEQSLDFHGERRRVRELCGGE